MSSGIFVRYLLVAAALACAAAPAAAQPVAAPAASPLEVRLTAMKISQDASGREVAQSAASAKPGDVIEYRVTYANKGKSRIGNVEATLPVPTEMEYIAGSAKPERVSASTDGSTFAPVPLKRKVRSPDGREIEQEVTPAEYRSLRWTLGEIDAGRNAVVTARMRVLPVAPPRAGEPAPKPVK